MKTACLILSTLLWILTSQGVARAEQSSLRSAGKPADAKAQSGRVASTSNHEPGPQNGRNRFPARKPITASQSDMRVARAENGPRSTVQLPPAVHPVGTPESQHAHSDSQRGSMAARRVPAAVVHSTGPQPLASANHRNANSPLIDGNMTTRRKASSAIDGTAIHRRR